MLSKLTGGLIVTLFATRAGPKKNLSSSRALISQENPRRDLAMLNDEKRHPEAEQSPKTHRNIIIGAVGVVALILVANLFLGHGPTIWHPRHANVFDQSSTPDGMR
jgi:hypothetical protein